MINYKPAISCDLLTSKEEEEGYPERHQRPVDASVDAFGADVRPGSVSGGGHFVDGAGHAPGQTRLSVPDHCGLLYMAPLAAAAETNPQAKK